MTKGHRLVSRFGKVNDGKASVTKSDACVSEAEQGRAASVGSTMNLLIGHGPKHICVRPVFQVNKASYSTHVTNVGTSAEIKYLADEFVTQFIKAVNVFL
jgi:hypothetical protein